jgi:hypothetical protein
MLLYNSLLLLHFLSFIGYLITLMAQLPDYHTKVRSAKGLILGILILVTGIGLALMKYPHINYYKVIPKTGLFVIVTAINVRFGGRPYTKTAYYALIALTILAACIAVIKV